MREAGTDSGMGVYPTKNVPEKGPLMRKAFVSVLALALTAAGPLVAAGAEVKTEEQKTLYALGLALSQSLSTFALSDKELDLVKEGLTDGVLVREHKVGGQPYMPKIQEFQKRPMAPGGALAESPE